MTESLKKKKAQINKTIKVSRKLINASQRNPFPYIHHCMMPLCRCAIHISAIHQIHHHRMLGNVYRTEELVKSSSLGQTCSVCCRDMSTHTDALSIQPCVPGASSTRWRYQCNSNNWLLFTSSLYCTNMWAASQNYCQC